MTARIVARSLAVATLAVALAATAATPATAVSAHPATRWGGFSDTYELPPGFQPEGITIDWRGTAYLGSLADGDIYALDLRSGEGEVVSEGPGSPSVGLKVDWRGRLFIAGGTSGQARVVSARTGEELASYQLTTDPAFINDVVLTWSGAWFTDSQAAQLYRLPLDWRGLPDADEVEPLPLTGDWEQQPGFNANGIATTPDGRALLVIQTATGLLFRVDPATGVATRVDLGGELLANGDGLLTIGRTLYVVQNRLNTVAEVRLDWAGTRGEVVDKLTDPAFDVPTTVAAYFGSLFLPNARFTTPPTPETAYQVVRIDR